MPSLKHYLLSGLIILGSAVAGGAQATNWTGYTYSSVSTTAAVKGMERIADRVDKETDGDLSITLHLGKTLQIASSDITQATGDGIVDFGHVALQQAAHGRAEFLAVGRGETKGPALTLEQQLVGLTDVVLDSRDQVGDGRKGGVDDVRLVPRGPRRVMIDQ